jgi:Nidogen-like
MFAPFWADVDTRNAGSGLVTFGTGIVDGHDAFGVNWNSVGYFPSAANLLNNFQAIVISRPETCPIGVPGCGNFDLEFNYDQIQWETGGASGGVGGLGGSSARVGYTNGTGTAFELAGSAVNGAFLNGGPNSLVAGSFNSGVAGRYVFEVRNSSIGTPGASQATPVLPNQVLPGPPLVNVFNNVRSGTWIDPPGTVGFEYTGLAGTLFSSVGLPTGFTDPFTVWIPDGIGGFQVAGSVPGGGAFNFAPGGIGAFRITGINPTVDSDNPVAFPTQVFFTTASGSLNMTALFDDSGSGGGGVVPEPSSYLLGLTGLAALIRLRLASRPS